MIEQEQKVFNDFDHSPLKLVDIPLKFTSVFENNVTSTNRIHQRTKQPSMGVSAYSLKMKRNRLTNEENPERVVQRRYNHSTFFILLKYLI